MNDLGKYPRLRLIADVNKLANQNGLAEQMKRALHQLFESETKPSSERRLQVRIGVLETVLGREAVKALLDRANQL